MLVLSIKEIVKALLEQPYIGVLIVLALSIIGSLIGFIACYFIAPKRPSIVKERRFEAGNPPTGPPKTRLAMQYLGFVLLLTTVEPIIVITTILIVGALGLANAWLIIGIAIVLSIIAVYFAYRYSITIREWMLD